MSEILLVERIIYFAIAFGITFVGAVFHGFLLARHPRISWLVPAFFSGLSVFLIIYNGWEAFASSFVQAGSLYVIIGAIAGIISGYALGFKAFNVLDY